MNVIAGDIATGWHVGDTIRINTVIIVAVHLATIVKSPGQN